MLIVGLGNIGKEYERTRHNIGFILLDLLVEKYSFAEKGKKFDGQLFQGEILEKKIYCLKPETYMNNSGISVSKAMSFYKIPIGEVLVIHDDIDLEFCKIKYKKGGGHGGHNGLKSIDHHCGKNYFRMRFGISHPGEKTKVSSHVLGKFSVEEEEDILTKMKKIVEKFPILLSEEKSLFLNSL